MDTTKVSLNAGELSDDLAGRIDLTKVQMGCETAENVRVLRTGAMTRRAGLKYVGTTEDIAQKSRLKGFNFSGEQGTVIEFGNLTMRFLVNGGYVMSGMTPYEIVSPWTSAQVFALQFTQRINTIVVTHPDVAPQLITRVADNSWSVADFPWQERIWLSDGAPTNAQLSVSHTSGNNRSLTSSTALFDSSWVGTRVRLGHVRPEQPASVLTNTVATGAVAANLVAANYTVGAKIFHTTGTRTAGKYAGLTPIGNYQYFTCIANYAFATGYTGSANPDDYPTFFMQGLVAINAVEVDNEWEFETAGTWNGTYVAERSYDAGATWSAVRTATSNSNKNYLVQDTEDPDLDAQFRILMLDMDNTTIVRVSFRAFASTKYGYGVVDQYNSTTSLRIDIEQTFESTLPTNVWSEDAFNPKNGYPKTCTFHQKRLFFGGSDSRPQKLWGSKTQQPYNFSFGTLADGALDFETEATEYESVLWLVSHLSLLVGTTSGIWAISAPDGVSVTAESNAITRQVKYGVKEGFPAVPLQNNVLFLQAKGRKIHELTGGSVDYGGYTNVDLTQLASHITRGGVTQIESVEIPDTALCVVTGGELAILTYERAQNIVGWARWVTDGVIESVATCRGDGEDDDIYVAVKRNINGSDTRYVEYLSPDMLRVEEDGDMDNLNFLDSSITQVFDPATTTITGLSHLNGETVGVFADGEPIGNFVVASGEIQLPSAVSTVTVGLNYTSLLKTMPLDRGSIGRKSNINEVTIRFRNSLGGQSSQDGINWTDIVIPQPRVVGNEPLPLASADANLNIHSTWDRKIALSIRQTQPLPMTILAIRISSKVSN